VLVGIGNTLPIRDVWVVDVVHHPDVVVPVLRQWCSAALG
jgi:hypothetical protein